VERYIYDIKIFSLFYKIITNLISRDKKRVIVLKVLCPVYIY